MKRFAVFLERHQSLLLFFCAALFGFAWGLTHERSVVPSPHWYTPSLQRFCMILMAWTALMHSDPLQRFFWSLTDCLVLSLPFLAGVLFAPAWDISSLIRYELSLGKIAAGAVFGVAITQGAYSLLPDWRARWERRATAMRETTGNAEAQPIADEPGIKERVSAFVHRVRYLSLFECLTGSGLTGRSRRS